MNREQAAAILGCSPRSPAPVVKAAFSEAVKAAHPDGGMLPSGGAREAGFAIARLKEARDFMLADAPTACPRCYGSGWVAVGFKQERCPKGC